MVKTLYTVGYEGLTINGFLAMIDGPPIALIVDARERPLSRKPGFSKRALQEALERLNVGYRHMPELGSPSVLRHQFKESGNWALFRAGYSNWLGGQLDSINTLRRFATLQTIGVLCFEADVNLCHRSILVESVLESLEGYLWTDLSRYGARTLECLSSSSLTRARVVRMEKRTALQDCSTVGHG